MNYYLVSYQGKSIAPITGCLNSHTLQDILDFTTKFSDEKALQKYLQQHNLLKSPDASLKIDTFSQKYGTYKLLATPIPYQDTKQFLNISNIKNYFLENLTNPDFIQAFLSHYYNYLGNISLFQEDLENILYGIGAFQKTHEVSKYYRQSMLNFLTNYMIRFTTKKESVMDTRRIYELAVFISSYERKTQEKDTNYPSILEELQHYEAILKEGNITDEQELVYQSHIQKLTKILERID